MRLKFSLRDGAVWISTAVAGDGVEKCEFLEGFFGQDQALEVRTILRNVSDILSNVFCVRWASKRPGGLRAQGCETASRAR